MDSQTYLRHSVTPLPARLQPGVSLRDMYVGPLGLYIHCATHYLRLTTPLPSYLLTGMPCTLKPGYLSSTPVPLWTVKTDSTAVAPLSSTRSHKPFHLAWREGSIHNSSR